MPKQTTKYITACAVAGAIGIHTNFNNREELYTALKLQNWHWNSETKEWENYDDIPANNPSPMIRVRVWADAQTVEKVAIAISNALTADGLTLVHQSDAYPCRPPAHREARIYLDFLAEPKQPSSPAPKPGDAVLGSQH